MIHLDPKPSLQVSYVQRHKTCIYFPLLYVTRRPVRDV